MHLFLFSLLFMACGHHAAPAPASDAAHAPEWRPPRPPDCVGVSAPDAPPALVAAWHGEHQTRTWAAEDIATLDRVYHDGGGETLTLSLADGGRMTLLERPQGHVDGEARWLSTSLDVDVVDSGTPPPPEQTTPRPDVTIGTLDKSAVGNVVMSDLSTIQECYQSELLTRRLLRGYLRVKFVIAKDGTVSRADVVATTLNDATVEDCVVDRFLGYVFPEPVGGGIVIVSYPFVFMSPPPTRSH